MMMHVNLSSHLACINPASFLQSTAINTAVDITKSPANIFFFQISISLRCTPQYGIKHLPLLPFQCEFNTLQHSLITVFLCAQKWFLFKISTSLLLTGMECKFALTVFLMLMNPDLFYLKLTIAIISALTMSISNGF